MKIDLIRTEEPFASLFPIHKDVLQRVTESIKARGYKISQPIICWNRSQLKKGPFIVIDGHTRLAAAKDCDLMDIPVVVEIFENEDQAVEYAIHCQRDRRNLTDADLLRWVGELQQRRRGRASNLNPQPCGFTASETAAMVGVSKRKVEQTRTVLEHADDKAKAAVLAGEKSINQTCNEWKRPKNYMGTAKKVHEAIHEEKPKEVVDEEFVKAHTSLLGQIHAAKQKKWATISQQTAARMVKYLLVTINYEGD